MKIIPLIVLIFLFSFCSKKDNSPYPSLNLPKSKNAIQVNTQTMLHTSLDNKGCFFAENFDTIIDEKPVVSEWGTNRFKWDTVFPKYDFKIIIDTSYTITVKGIEHKNIPFERSGIVDWSKVFALWDDYVVCYPLLIYNNSTKTAYSNYYIKLIQEAKDTDGKWKPIEYFAGLSSCIPLHDFHEYLPNKYSSLAVIKYEGSYKTKIRTKIKIGKYTYYSNEIVGHINKSQFDKHIAEKMLRFYCQFCDVSIPVTNERLARSFLEK
jgi:hypothetical protein